MQNSPTSTFHHVHTATLPRISWAMLVLVLRYFSINSSMRAKTHNSVVMKLEIILTTYSINCRCFYLKIILFVSSNPSWHAGFNQRQQNKEATIKKNLSFNDINNPPQSTLANLKYLKSSFSLQEYPWLKFESWLWREGVKGSNLWFFLWNSEL